MATERTLEGVLSTVEWKTISLTGDLSSTRRFLSGTSRSIEHLVSRNLTVEINPSEASEEVIK